MSAADRVFAIPELFEHIFSVLLAQLLGVTDQENPRSVKTHANAQVLLQMLQCSQVNRTWQHCILGSFRLQSALFLAPSAENGRTWELRTAGLAPILNPIIQTTFPSYNLRFRRTDVFGRSDRYCASMIVTKRDLPAIQTLVSTVEGRNISLMFLSQPPCTALEASMYEERDESKDYIGRTSTLREPLVRCVEGLTLDMVHRKVMEIFAAHLDVSAIKLTTV